MLCRECNSDIDFGAEFCTNCGAACEHSEYPTIELKSSGPMKYRKTNLDIARLNLENVRIDLNEKYSSYVIPVSQSFPSSYTAYDKPAKQKSKMKSAPVMQNFAANAVNPAANYNRSAAYMPEYNQVVRQAVPSANKNTAPAAVRTYSKPNENDTAPQKTGALEFMLSLVAMMFMGFPAASILLSIAVIINTSKLEKSAKLKNAAMGIALFVLITSGLSLFARISA
ncbi:MAG: hypothetical protein IJO29_05120 [Oscillospiraceae bacterium]|nr:hypothetical protein [Oscillospiraceae bacterium]